MPLTNLLPLPNNLLSHIFIYDRTYREVFDIVLVEMRLMVQQERESVNLMVEHELEHNLFKWSAELLLADIFSDV